VEVPSLLVILWFFAVTGSLLALLSQRGERSRARWVKTELGRRAPDDRCPPATVMVPVKGHDEGLRENLAALAELDYPDYELIVVARSAQDIPAGVTPASARVILAGPGDPNTGEKINNLLAAVRAARPESEIFAFADSDGRVSPAWLRSLVAALERPGAGLATAYRWYVPRRANFWSLMRSVWNAAIAGTFHGGNNRFAWGGAMAIRRADFNQLRVEEYWLGALSDDYRISEAVRAAGLEIAFAPGATVACEDHTERSAFLKWMTRQLVITKACQPKLWAAGFVSHFLYCGAMAAGAALLAAGSGLAALLLAVQLLLGMWKGRLRATLAAAALPPYHDWFRRHGWVHAWGTPLATWIWLYGFLASAVTNTIVWRGYRYELRGPRIVRSSAHDTLEI
jgi:ceramide glucosyltransferase